MALLHSLPSIAVTTYLITLLLITLPDPTRSQVPSLTSWISHFRQLSPCVPYVQGKTQTPAQTCCINLKQVYTQKLMCLCLLVNGSTVGSLPINSTLALQLPAAWDLQVNVSKCSVSNEGIGVPVPPSRAGSQVSLGSNTKSTVAASPMVVPGAPRPASNTRHSHGLNADAKLNTDGQSAVVTAVFALFCNVLLLNYYS